MFKIHRTKTIMFITLTLILFQPLAAGSSIRQMNTTIIADLNQTIDEDIRSLVDTDRLEIERSPFFNVVWSPDENKVLLSTVLNVCPKGKGKTQTGYISALYMADKEFLNISRISWTEFTTTNHGKVIDTPSWSQSGEHFAYVELSQGKMYSIKSAKLFVVSTDLQEIEEIEIDNKMDRSYDDLFIYKWSPTEEKVAVPTPGKLVIYDPVQKSNLAFDIDNGRYCISDLEWSPDGKKLTFLENYKDIKTIHVDKKECGLIYSSERAGLYNPVWSPDSKKLVFYIMTETTKNGDSTNDIYVMDENTNTTEKINHLNPSHYWAMNWYPDSERLLFLDYSNGTSKLCSISITGEKKVLYVGGDCLEGQLGSNGYVSAKGQFSSFPPFYSNTYDLAVFNDSYKHSFTNVTHHKWINNDLMFTTDYKTSILNISTNTTWEISRSSRSPKFISISPSEHFIAIDNLILEMNYEKSPSTISRDQVNSTGIQIVALDNNSNYQAQANTTASSQSPGFSAILALIGFVAVLVYVHLKKQ